MKFLLTVFLVILLLMGCDNGFDKSLISDIEELPSLDGKYTLRRYYVESPMAFGSGFTVINIVKSDAEYDYTDRNVLRVHNGFPFYIRWKDSKTLVVKYLMSGYGMAKQQPVKKNVIKLKGWKFEAEYYGQYSSGLGQKITFDDCLVNGNFITFRAKNDSLEFNRSKVQLSIDGRDVKVKEFKVDSFDNKLGLSFIENVLTAAEGFDLRTLKSEQPFKSVGLPPD